MKDYLKLIGMFFGFGAACMTGACVAEDVHDEFQLWRLKRSLKKIKDKEETKTEE